MVLSLATVLNYHSVASAEPEVTSYVVRISQSFMERNLKGGGIFRLIVRGVETSYTPETGSPYRTFSDCHLNWDVEERKTDELILGDSAVDKRQPGIFFSCTYKYLAAANIKYHGSPYEHCLL